ncbi:MAG: hypothetical protein L6Q98_02365 [Anaerolineae bacterium]|nr:hypothetical protein [Anaerolineae bacterium]NUQ02920.1 hypothetical protein [Anaerolineae bacterium]
MNEICRHWAARIVLIVMALSAGAACTAVDVQVAALTTPTPAPPPTVYVPPVTVQAISAAGYVAYDTPDDSEVSVLNIADPYLVFASSGVHIEMMPGWSSGTEYFVVNTGRGIRLRATWRSLWTADSSGAGSVGLEVWLKVADAEGDYQWVDSAVTAEFESGGPDHREEVLDTTIYLPGAGRYQLRARTTVSARDHTAGAENAGESVYETEIIALNQPESYLNAVEDLTPRLGDLEAEQRAILDWRGWRYGPCFAQTEDTPDVTRLLDDACVASEAGDWETAANALQDALGALGTDAGRQNRLRQQLGTLAAVSGNWNVAVRHFREGLNAAFATDDAFEIAIALHNLAVALHFAGFEEEVEPLLWASITLRDQMGDYPAALLSYLQFAVWWESPDTFAWVVPSLYENGMPHAGLAQAWADELAAEAEEGG